MTTPTPPPAPLLDPRDARPGQDWLVPVSIADGLALVVWTVVGPMVAFSAVLLAFRLAGAAPPTAGTAAFGAVVVVVQSLVLASTLAWLAGRGRLSSRLLGSVRAGVLPVVQGLGGGVLAFGVSSTVLLLGDAALGPLEEPGQALLGDEMLAGPALLFTVVAAVVMAPLLEELVFRGVLFQTLGRRIGWVPGLLLTSVIFAVVHLEVVFPLGVGSVVFGTALLGVGAVFGLVFHRSRSLVAAVVAHATFNGVQLALATSGLV